MSFPAQQYIDLDRLMCGCYTYREVRRLFGTKLHCAFCLTLCRQPGRLGVVTERRQKPQPQPTVFDKERPVVQRGAWIGNTRDGAIRPLRERDVIGQGTARCAYRLTAPFAGQGLQKRFCRLRSQSFFRGDDTAPQHQQHSNVGRHKQSVAGKPPLHRSTPTTPAVLPAPPTIPSIAANPPPGHRHTTPPRCRPGRADTGSG